MIRKRAIAKGAGAALVAGTGVVFLYSTVDHGLSGEPAEALLFGSVLPGLIALGITVAGIGVYYRDLHPRDVWHIAGWIAVFISVGVGIALALGSYERAHGGVLVHYTHIITNTAIGAAGVGLLVGVYDVRRKQQERRLNVETRILDTVREIHRGIVTAETQSDLETHVCETLAESEPYLFAWIGEVEDTTDEVVPRTAVGVGDDYLESITITVDGTPRGPTAKAIATEEPHAIQNIRDDPEYEPWRDEAVEYGFRSSLAVPIVYHETSYGVLNVYADRPNAFRGRERDTLAELGETIGYAIHALHEERARARENERLDRFASIVSHDLRNPLNVADGYLSIAMEECDTDSLETVQSSLDRMAAIIEDALALARDGGVIDQLEPVELRSVVGDCWRTIPHGAASLQVETDMTIRGDESRVQQLLENLLQNAVEHAGGGVTIRIGALPDRDGFYVADDGKGIPETERDAVFEPGYSTDDDGTGLGLLIVEEIADAHGWTVTVTESAAGGARFELSGVDVVE